MDAPSYSEQLELIDELLVGLDQSQPDLNALASRAEGIPSLVIPVIRASNSSLFGLRRRVNSMERAFAMLGAARIKSIAAEVRVLVERESRRRTRAA